MKSFNRLSELNIFINKKLYIVLTKVADLAMQKLMENVQSSVYGWTPKQYQRTGQVLASISKTAPILNGGKYTVEIYFDPLKIQPIINEHAWNAHADFNGQWAMGGVSSKTLINWLENGTPNNKYFQHPSHGFLKETVEWLQSEYVGLFKEILRQQGINCD